MELYNESLLREFIDYSDDIVFKQKVNRVMRKCIKSGKLALADKISEKYSNLLPKSDLVIALSMAYACLLKNKTK